jgi:hypothetical protein
VKNRVKLSGDSASISSKTNDATGDSGISIIAGVFLQAERSKAAARKQMHKLAK